MKSIGLVLGFAATLATSILLTVALADQPSASVPASSTDPLARGRYLVFQAGLCIDCHSPRNDRGEFIEAQHLMGAPIPFQPTIPMPWMPAAPRISGLPAGFTEKELVHFLMTGERPAGRTPPLPPMPPYRFNRDDATAIAAFLASLPAK